MRQCETVSMIIVNNMNDKLILPFISEIPGEWS